MGEPLRVVLADDHYLVREGTRSLLEDTGQVEVVATARRADELLLAVEEHRPDVVITDIRMPPTHSTEGIRAAHDIRRSFPDIGVIALSQYIEGGYALDPFQDGTEGLGYLLKERIGDLDELMSAMRTVAAGGSTIDPKVVDVLVASRRQAQQSTLRHLTARELEVLRETAQGRNNAGVAAALHLSESAVEKHVSSIFLKLGCRRGPPDQPAGCGGARLPRGRSPRRGLICRRGRVTAGFPTSNERNGAPETGEAPVPSRPRLRSVTGATQHEVAGPNHPGGAHNGDDHAPAGPGDRRWDRRPGGGDGAPTGRPAGDRVRGVPAPDQRCRLVPDPGDQRDRRVAGHRGARSGARRRVPDPDQRAGERDRKAARRVSNGGRRPDGTVAHTIKRAVLSRILREVAAERGIRVQHGKRMVGAEHTPDGRVVAAFDDGTSTAGDVLIGCDGIHSTTRRSIDSGAPAGRYVGLTNFGGYTEGSPSTRSRACGT